MAGKQKPPGQGRLSGTTTAVAEPARDYLAAFADPEPKSTY